MSWLGGRIAKASTAGKEGLQEPPLAFRQLHGHPWMVRMFPSGNPLKWHRDRTPDLRQRGSPPCASFVGCSRFYSVYQSTVGFAMRASRGSSLTTPGHLDYPWPPQSMDPKPGLADDPFRTQTPASQRLALEKRFFEQSPAPERRVPLAPSRHSTD